MPTLTAALAAFERHCGFSQSRSRSVARRLQEHGMLSLGAPGVPPAIDHAGFVRLFVAVAADTTHREAPAAVRTYLAMSPGGLPISADAPSSIVRAEAEIMALVETSLDAPADLADLQIEVVASWPEIAIHWDHGQVHRYQPVGALANHWGATSHRRSTTVPGTAFRDAVRATFPGDSR